MLRDVSFIYDIDAEIGYKFVEISIRKMSQGKNTKKKPYILYIISLSFDVRWVIYKINISSEILRMRKIRFDLLFSIRSDERFIHYSLCKHFHLNFFFDNISPFPTNTLRISDMHALYPFVWIYYLSISLIFKRVRFCARFAYAPEALLFNKALIRENRRQINRKCIV